MLEYKVVDEDPEDFTSAKKVEFRQEVALNNQVIEQAIIADGSGGLGRRAVGLFTQKEDGLTNEEEWSLKFEAMNERQLLLRLADLADNREVQIK